MTQVLLLCGSLRAQSVNQILLEVAASMAPAHVTCTQTDALADLPLYNQDLDGASPPAAVARLRQAIADADGLVIAMPEYNHGVPGVLKNAIDWASRPHGFASLRGKAVAVLVATPGQGFGFQGSGQLRFLLADLSNFVVPGPLLVVQKAGDKLRRDADGTAVFDDVVGRRLLAANWAGLLAAIDKGAGDVCLAGARAFVASAP